MSQTVFDADFLPPNVDEETKAAILSYGLGSGDFKSSEEESLQRERNGLLAKVRSMDDAINRTRLQLSGKIVEMRRSCHLESVRRRRLERKVTKMVPAKENRRSVERVEKLLKAVSKARAEKKAMKKERNRIASKCRKTERKLELAMGRIAELNEEMKRMKRNCGKSGRKAK